MKRLIAEFLGTFVLVLGGCGSAVLAADHIGVLGVSLAFGLTVLCMIYAVGHISGAHFNPAVSLGLWMGGRFNSAQLIPYIVAQVLGATAAAGILYLILSGHGYISEAGLGIGSFATNGFGEHSPGGYNMQAALITEIIMTFVFVLIILGATDSRAPKGFAGVAIGLALTLVHLVSIPVTNTSVNPARSTSQALFVGGEAMGQLWLFWVAPIIGALMAGLVYRAIEK